MSHFQHMLLFLLIHSDTPRSGCSQSPGLPMLSPAWQRLAVGWGKKPRSSRLCFWAKHSIFIQFLKRAKLAEMHFIFIIVSFILAKGHLFLPLTIIVGIGYRVLRLCCWLDKCICKKNSYKQHRLTYLTVTFFLLCELFKFNILLSSINF